MIRPWERKLIAIRDWNSLDTVLLLCLLCCQECLSVDPFHKDLPISLELVWE